MIVAGQLINYDSVVFRELFNKLFPSLCIIASRIMKDEEKGKDIAQDAFVKLWEKTNEEFADETALQAYLYVLVKNSCIDGLRKEKNVQWASLDDHQHLATEHLLLDEILREETHRLLSGAIKSLSKQSALVVELTLQGLSNIEIAEELGVTVNTIKTVKKRAYLKLRSLLGNQLVAILLTQLIHFFG
jgi:RNA polymerase sigma-70 factor (ECF subfamily)